MQEELERRSGSVSAVVFQNPENGYCVLRLKDGDDQFTAVGTVPGVQPGDRLQVEGRWTTHGTYGRQLELVSVEHLLPASRSEILAYLSSHAIHGVGPKLAARIVERFGDETLAVIEHRPAELARVSGISPAKAQEIHESYLSRQGLRKLAEYLNTYRLPPDLAVKLWRAFGEFAVETLRDDPYLLTGEEFGAPFDLVDAFALAEGMDGDDERRVDAGVLYELSYNCAGGHSFVPRTSLVQVTSAFLNLPSELITEALGRLVESERILVDPIAGLDAVYLPAYGLAERALTERFLEMADTAPTLPPNLAATVAEIERAQGIQYALQQKEAIYAAAGEKLLLVTGGPGTGKTTTLRGILDLYDRLHLKTAVAAPTGRAAKRLTELTGREASTIHRLLEVDLSGEDGAMAFVHNAAHPLTCDAVIVDETSMVDLLLMHALVDAMPPRARLILVGDPDQLPSVGAGNVFADLIRSERIPTVMLTEIFRQARESLIVMNAHRVNRGELPALQVRDRDFFFLSRSGPEAVAQTIVELCKTRLPDRMGIPPEEIQVLTPTRKGETGTRELNRLLQQALNPPAEGKAEKKYGDFVYRVGDRVMQTRNNYDILWKKTGGGLGTGIFNGDIGTVRAIDYQAQTVTLQFDDREAVYPYDLLGQIEPAYAVTVHKSQGSEYRAVVLCAWRAAAPLLTRSILYTAITRARELLIVVGDRQVVEYMVGNDKKQKRFSGLKWRLKNYEKR